MKRKAMTRWRRKMRVRAKIAGTAERPRLTVSRSSSHIYAQLVDDRAGRTIAAVSSLSPSCRERLRALGKTDAAREVGGLIAEIAKGKGIGAVVFDRGSYRYHGRVRALAEGARGGGLRF
ncbi:MAG: 50S ribosomal protein L18 [bacterium]|nr:50S ribosomal protein L18 [bacterium]